MKKAYEAPKAEKMEFNYSEAVVASGKACDWFITLTQEDQGCEKVEVQKWQPDTNT